MFVQVDYAFEDIKNSIFTTDLYIENYLPFKLGKETTRLFLEALAPKEQSRFGSLAEKINEN